MAPKPMTPVMAMRGQFPNSPIPLPVQATSANARTQTFPVKTQVLTHKKSKALPVVKNTQHNAPTQIKAAMQKTRGAVKAVKVAVK